MPLDEAFRTRLERRRSTQDTPRGKEAAGEGSVRDCILVVDDERGTTASLAELLGRKYQVLTAFSAEEGFRLLEEHDVALILTDQRMPGGTGVELLTRSLTLAPEATRILFTGYADIGAVIQAINDGKVYLYVTKPWQPEELEAVVRQGLERFHLFRENRELLERLQRANDELEDKVRTRTQELVRQNGVLEDAQQRIEELLRQDALTGIANRRRLDEALDQEVKRAERYGSSLSAILADLDHFKQVNDGFGHLVGDTVLQGSARVLRENARTTDLVGRYGGEEFLLILPNTDLSAATAQAERLRRALESRPATFRAEPVTASFGVASWMPGDGPQNLVAKADEALYLAKRKGRNRVEA
jgi:diguanylate cyclase (GGDEF)-like protein